MFRLTLYIPSFFIRLRSQKVLKSQDISFDYLAWSTHLHYACDSFVEACLVSPVLGVEVWMSPPAPARPSYHALTKSRHHYPLSLSLPLLNEPLSSVVHVKNGNSEAQVASSANTKNLKNIKAE